MAVESRQLSVASTETPARRTLCHVNLARGFRGGERQTELLVRALAGSGWAQRVVARAGEPLAARLRGLSRVEVRECSGTLGAVRAIGRPDLIHVHEGRSLRSAWLNSLLTGVPYLMTRRVQTGPRRHPFNRMLYRRSAGIVALSRAIRASIQQLDPSLSCVIIPSASSRLPSDGTVERALLDSWGGDFVVGHVAALVASAKGQMQIVEVARALSGSRPDMRFVLVGGGPDEALLRDATRDLPNVILTGQVEDVGNYLAAFDVFLLPSRHEGLGSILLDALEFGLPIVATRVGGIPEIVEDGGNGILIEYGDLEGMKTALLRLAADPQLRLRISRANLEKAKAFSPERMAQSYLTLYEQMTSGASSDGM